MSFFIFFVFHETSSISLSILPPSLSLSLSRYLTSGYLRSTVEMRVVLEFKWLFLGEPRGGRRGKKESTSTSALTLSP